MTHGVIADDFRQNVLFPSVACRASYTRLLGRRHDRSWDGEDYPSSNPKPRTTPYSPPFLMRGVRVPISYAYRERYAANGYRRAPKRAYVVDHNYTMVDFERTTGTSAYDIMSNSCPPPNNQAVRVRLYESFEQTTGGVGHSFGWSSNDDLALLGRLREKVQGEGFNAGVAFAEAGQGLTQIAGAARDINRAYGNVRRGNFVGAWRNLTGLGLIPPHVARRLSRENLHDAKVVAKNWLAFQYGWKPLLADVHDAAAVLGHLLNTPLQRTVRCSKKVKGEMHCQVFYLKVADPVCFTRTSIIAKIREASVPQLLGLTSPYDIVWEKTPFSFVADWFIPIGAWLSARGLASSLDATFVISKKHHAECHSIVPTGLPGHEVYIPGYDPYDPAFNPAFAVENFDYKWVGFSRTVSNELLVPLPAFKPLGKIPSWERAASAISLLLTNFGSVGRGNTGRTSD
jgi:hypothetical protein